MVFINPLSRSRGYGVGAGVGAATRLFQFTATLSGVELEAAHCPETTGVISVAINTRNSASQANRFLCVSCVFKALSSLSDSARSKAA